MNARKLLWNVLAPRAVTTLGPRTYATYLARLAGSTPAVLRGRSLRPGDVGMRAHRFHYRGQEVVFDCAWNDAVVADGSYAFGAVRELLIRDVYFRHQPPGTYERIGSALDLGANRGLVSVMLSKTARRVLAVEAQPQLIPVIENNLSANAISHARVIRAFVGAGGKLPVGDTPRLMMQELCAELDDSVDFVKLDVEGSEFALFRDDGWLRSVRAISAELHASPDASDRGVLQSALDRHGFAYRFAREDLTLVRDIADAAFLYAWRA